MGTLKLKTVCNLSASAVFNGLAHPDADTGEFGIVRIVEITDIPEGISCQQVVRAWRETCDISNLANDLKYPRHTYAFSELGDGKIIRAAPADGGVR